MPDINGETLTLTLDTDKHSKPSEMQARLDMMQRVLRKLPVEELEKYEIDLSADVLEGTEMASRYVLAWEERQQELRKVWLPLMTFFLSILICTTIVYPEGIRGNDEAC